jgi:hypothetical protein
MRCQRYGCPGEAVGPYDFCAPICATLNKKEQAMRELIQRTDEGGWKLDRLMDEWWALDQVGSALDEYVRLTMEHARP